MDLKTNLYEVEVIKNDLEHEKMFRFPYHVIIHICDDKKYVYYFNVEPKEKYLKTCLHDAINKYILSKSGD